MKNLKNILLVLVVLAALSFVATRYYANNMDTGCYLFQRISNYILYFGILPIMTFILIKDKK